MLYSISHTTRYRYPHPVSLSHHMAHLSPRDRDGQTCIRTDLAIDPLPDTVIDRLDFFGNPVRYFSIERPHDSLEVTACHQVSVLPPVMPDLERTPPWEEVREEIGADATGMLAFFSQPSTMVRPDNSLRAYAAPSFPAGRPILAASFDLSRRIHADFLFDALATDVATPLEQVMRERRGVCQDFAHLQLGCLRSLGLATRYVSGYLRTLPPPGTERLAGADASHAWISVYAGAGTWVDLDPTNAALVGTDHVSIAWGRDYDDVSPLRGVMLGGGAQSLEVSVDVLPAE